MTTNEPSRRVPRLRGSHKNLKGNSVTTRVSVDAVMLQKLKQDLRDLPGGPGMDEYEDMPVEGFGAALLAGYGWHEGRGIGRNANGYVKIVQYERRTGKEGLGFIVDMRSVNEKVERSGKRSRGEEERKKVREKRLEKNK